MKAYFAAAVLTALVTQSAFAADPYGPRTRAQVYAELIEAQENGSRYVTEASYPDVSIIHQERVKKMREARAAKVAAAEAGQSGEGPAITGTSDAGSGTHHHGAERGEKCVGPASFCNLYFGS
jgi:hypothetical protein